MVVCEKTECVRDHYLQDNPVYRHNELSFFGPWIGEAKPLTLKRDVGAVLGFELVVLRLNLLFASKDCGEIGYVHHLE